MKDLVEKLNEEIAAEQGKPAKRKLRRRSAPAGDKKAPASKAAKRVIKKESAPAKGKALSYWKVAFGLSGNKTRAYMVAVLRVLAIANVKRPAVRKQAISKFFSCDSVVRYHIKKGNLEQIEAGTVRLTETGLEFFKERNNLKDDIAAFESAIRKGESCGYELLPVEIVK